MHFIGYVFYRIFILLYWCAAHVLSFFQPKTERWLQGRKAKTFLHVQRDKNKPLAWFHAASTGEFEQAFPLIQQLKANHPETEILLTFYSPSGYEAVKKKSTVDYIHYLPFDFPGEINSFLDVFEPTIAVFVKYDFWYHAINMTSERGIPVYLVSARFRKNQLFFKVYGKLFKQLLEHFEHIFVQDIKSLENLESIHIKRVSISGDTRFERVIEIKNEAKAIHQIQDFKENLPLLVAGSTWPADDALLANFMKKHQGTFQGKYLIVPHEVNEKSVKKAAEKYGDNTVLFSQGKVDGGNVMILDAMGYLSSAYAYARYTYVGGGFGKGIHNILEAAVYGIPVFFGPNFYKFKEAEDLIALKSAFEITNNDELEKHIRFFEEHPAERENIKQTNEKYFSENANACKVIMQKLNLHF